MKIEVRGKNNGKLIDAFDVIQTLRGLLAENRFGKWVLLDGSFESVKNYIESVNRTEFGYAAEEVNIELVDDVNNFQF